MLYLMIWILVYQCHAVLALSFNKNCSATTTSLLSRQQYGHSLLGTEFLLTYTNFNHGSFGSCPKTVLKHQSSLRLLQEQRPDPWMRQHYRELVNATREEISNYLGVGFDGLVLVESASTGVNAIMRSLDWKSDKKNIIMYFSIAYGMVKNTANWLKQQQDRYQNNNIEIVEIPVTFPVVNDASFTTPMRKALNDLQERNELDHLRLVVLDHIASVPAVREPVQELAGIVKQFAPACFVLVDGAHTMGQIPNLNISEMAPIDAYITNGHKWLYSPKGSAVLWVNQTVVNDVFPEPTVVSSANKPGHTSLSERFQYVSTRDYTATIAMAEALAFRRTTLGGEEKLYNYIRCLAISAKSHLMKTWGVDALAPNEMEEFMINIKLPLTSAEQGETLQSWLLEKHNVYMLVLHYSNSQHKNDNNNNNNTNTMMLMEEDYYYTRLSTQVYLEFSDFVKLGNLVLEFVRQHNGNVLASSSLSG